MDLGDKTVAITGAGRGIGYALAIRCAALGARVAAADLDEDLLSQLGADLGPRHRAVRCDVADERDLVRFIEHSQTELGSIDVFIANAGVASGTDVVETPPEVWSNVLAVNLQSHVWAARELLPGWLARGSGYFVSVASAAGLLTQIGSAPYAVSKHGAVAFAEWLSITYGGRGLRVSCVCPMGVQTRMLCPGADGALSELGSAVVRQAGDLLDPAQVADQVVAAIEEERFLVLPHPEVLTFMQRRAHDPERWIAGMRRVQEQARAESLTSHEPPHQR